MWPHGPRSRLCTLHSLSAHISATVSFCRLPKSGLEVHACHVPGHTRRTCLAQQLGKPGHHVKRLSHCSKPGQSRERCNGSVCFQCRTTNRIRTIKSQEVPNRSVSNVQGVPFFPIFEMMFAVIFSFLQLCHVKKCAWQLFELLRWDAGDAAARVCANA